jgi:hypothetical protein
MKWGREKTYEVLKRLIGFGYITRAQERDSWTQSYGEVVYTVYSNPDDNPNFRVKTDEPLPEAPLPANPDHLIRTDRNQKYITTIIKPVVPAPSRNSASTVVRRNPLRDQLADLLFPDDRSTGYEMLNEDPLLEELVRKLSANTLDDDTDLMPIRKAYLIRGRRRPK